MTTPDTTTIQVEPKSTDERIAEALETIAEHLTNIDYQIEQAVRTWHQTH